MIADAALPARERAPRADAGVQGSERHGVVFVGVGIFPHRVAGDKNFLLDLSAHLRADGIPTSFVSIVTGPQDLRAPEDFTFVRRFLHQPTERFVKRGADGAIIGYRHPHGVARTWAELSSTLVRARATLRRSLAQYDRAIVHWIDSSLVVPALRAVCGERHRYVASVFRYLPQAPAARALRSFALGRAHRVLTGTESSRRLLVGEGCSADRVVVAPWGCPSRPDARVATDARPETRLLWSGFLQQIGREDLLRTIKLAQRVRQQRSDVEFTFSLKPECFTAEYAALRQPGVDVRTDGPAFLRNLSAFDAFLSPVMDNRSTPAPPLTWLEALACGVPIVTTAHPGVDEVVTDGGSGIVAEDYEDLETRLLDPLLKSRLQRMRGGAHQRHAVRYDIRTVARQYAGIYRELFAQQP